MSSPSINKDTTHRSNTINSRTTTTQKAKTTNDAPSTSPAKKKSDDAPAGSGTTRNPARATLSTSLESRKIKNADPMTLQMRGRLESALAAKKKSEGFTENKDGSYTFNGTKGDDHYTVTQKSDGGVTVKNEDSGKEYSLTSDQASNGVTINAGKGDDSVKVKSEAPKKGADPFGGIFGPPAKVSNGLVIDGGSGDDHISAKGSSGPVEIHGGRGDDHLTGGDGDDDLDGGEGNDHINGGEGMDSVRGGDGDDHLNGGKGNDQVLGQDGNDIVRGGEGDDFIMGGKGKDKLSGGQGGDNIYADKDDKKIDAGKDDGALDLIVSEDGSVAAKNMGDEDVSVHYDKAATEKYLKDHPELVIEGSDDFVARSQADIGVMLSTKEGRGLLDSLTTALKKKGETMTFNEKEEGPGGSYQSATNTVRTGNWAERYPDGTNRMPLPAMFHEMVHGYQDLVSGFPAGQSAFPGGGTVNNLERQATGLPWIDESGKVHPANELPYTDNIFRRALGLPERTTYGGETGDPTRYAGDTGPDNDN